jgi:hypothetical protein
VIVGTSHDSKHARGQKLLLEGFVVGLRMSRPYLLDVEPGMATVNLSGVRIAGEWPSPNLVRGVLVLKFYLIRHAKMVLASTQEKKTQ